MSLSRKRRNRYLGAAGMALAVMVGVGTAIMVGGDDDQIPYSGNTSVLWLLGSRDADQTGPVYGVPAGGPADNKPLAADVTWTQTGGERCYPTGVTTAVCIPGGEVAYTIDSTGTGWVVEPSQTNLVVYNESIDATNWTTAGSPTSTTGQADPSGGTGASLLTISSTDKFYKSRGSGYTNNAPLYPRVWVKCGSGLFRITNPLSVDYGHWTVLCATIGTDWVLIRDPASQDGVTEINPWVASPGGGAGIVIYGAGAATVTVWAPTLTEEPGTKLSVIPTAAAGVSTGDVAWTIANSTGRYYKAGDAVIQSVGTYAGTCVVFGATEIHLAGAAGSECAGILYSLEVRR